MTDTLFPGRPEPPPGSPQPGHLRLPGPDFAVEVHGVPGPQGSKSEKGRLPNGRARLVESSKKVKPWRHDVQAAAREAIDAMPSPAEPGDFEDAAGWTALDGPLVVSMVFTLRKPQSAPKRRRTWPDRYPDLSKLARSTEDALKDEGVIVDDARIVEYARLAKVFPGEDPDSLRVPGVLVRIWRMEAWVGGRAGHVDGVWETVRGLEALRDRLRVLDIEELGVAEAVLLDEALSILGEGRDGTAGRPG